MYAWRYWPHVWPLGGSKCLTSMFEHLAGAFATPTESIESTKYVKGETLYMNIWVGI
jgi:hypothetical protein